MAIKKWRSLDNRLLILLSIGIVVAVASTWIVRQLPGVQRLELLAYDWHSAALPTLGADERIVIVGMDGESLSHLPLDRPAYPLPRTIHARLLDELRQAGAKVVGFDIMFTRDIPNEDGIFARAIRGHGNVLCGIEPESTIDNGEEILRFTPPATSLRPHVRACALNAPEIFGRVRWVMPSIVDARTGERYMHLSVGLAAAYMNIPDGGELRGAFDIGPMKIPVGATGEMPIRFAGPAGTFKPIPYHEVYNGTWRKRGETFFENKIVVVGIVDPLADHHQTPLGDMQGVEALAQAVQAVLTSNWITHWSEAVNFGFKAVLVSILALAIWTLGIRRATIVAAVEGFLWLLGAHEVFVWRRLWADTVEPAGALVLSLIVSTSYETTRIRRVFSRFMPSWIAEEMLDSNPEALPETVEKDVTIVFCDIRDSTKLGETLPSATVADLLRRYFIAGEEAAVRLGTELDKFVGDEIMLFFEDRPGLEDHAIRGVRWALAIQDAAREITASGLAGDIGFRVGVGISTGRAQTGLVGAKHRIQHTVVGDAVNTASRLQAATKEVDRLIVVGESTWRRAKHKFKSEELGEIRVKGKQEPIRIYCPTGIIE